ncbi:MAG: O-antigen ligase family protein [Candidatus Saccharibacteria bacterium]
MDKADIKKLSIYIPACLILLIFALIPFHAFLTVWGSSLFGHYTAIRLWKEYLLVVCVLGAAVIFSTDRKVRELFYRSKLIQLILVFLVIELVWGTFSYNAGDVNTKALLYGWLSDTRYLIFFLVTLVISKKTALLRNKSIKFVIWPAVIVILFGLLQFLVLPKDFLSHFGYGPNTIYPFETINHNSQYLRIASTLRGANPLGAYLLVPLSLAAVLLMRRRKTWQMIIFIIAGTAVMIFSFSRSAWLGLIIALALAIYWGIKNREVKKRLLYVAVILVIVAGALFVIERNNSRVQNIVFHSQTNSAIKTTSDQAHSNAITTGLKQFATKPLGTGPGTAGASSVYNNHPANIPENYYLQIGLETGWLGLVVFLAINLLVALSLWRRRGDALSLALLISLIGLIVCNLLLEAWSDDTLCYLWWGLAGIAIAIKPKIGASKNNWII